MDIINFNLRLPEDINNKIVKIAEEEGRSKNKEIEYILREYIKKYEEKNKKRWKNEWRILYRSGRARNRTEKTSKRGARRENRTGTKPNQHNKIPDNRNNT